MVVARDWNSTRFNYTLSTGDVCHRLLGICEYTLAKEAIVNRLLASSAITLTVLLASDAARAQAQPQFR